MIDNFDFKLISFINQTDIIEQVEGGHSGALLYKITRHDNEYFLKIFNESYSIDKINKLKEILEIYNRLNIKSIDIISYGNISMKKQYYIVYNFINGQNLKLYTKNHDLKEVRSIGKYVGKKFLALKNYKGYNINNFKCIDIEYLKNSTIEDFFALFENNTHDNIILNYFSIAELNILKNKLEEYSQLFKNITPNLIHGDIKRSNIMVDQNDDLYIVDIESMQLSYDVLNFRYQITWALFNGNEREYEFVKGYFDGIYSNRPIYFNQQIIFVILINFFSESYKFYINGRYDKLICFVENCKLVLDKINKMDLDNEYII